MVTISDYTSRFKVEEVDQLSEYSWQEQLTTALDDATDVVRSLLRGVYVIPFELDEEELETTPVIITRIICDIARYYMHSGRPTDTVTEAYKEALSQLDALRTGRMKLNADVVNEEDTPYYV